MPVTDNLVSICRSYLLSIGVEQLHVNQLLNNELFNRGLIIQLSTVNVVKANRPEQYTSKQTHIHITGESMEFFYLKSYLDSVSGNTEDDNVRVELISSNIEHLNITKIARRNGENVSSFSVIGETTLLFSNTVKKVGHRGSQVQLSKTRNDGEDFIDLRTNLLPGDIMVFLEYNDSERGYLVMGLPSYYAEQTDLVHVESPVFTGERQSVVNSDFRIRLTSVVAENIATYSRTAMDEDQDRPGVDLSTAINIRGERTVRHQGILRILALYLQGNGFSLYEGNIDCLATKENVPTLIFEAKTLDGTPTDEAKQVRFALGQLIYYVYSLQIKYNDLRILKIAYFESEIADIHINLLRQNGCLVIWLNEQGEFCGDAKSLGFLQGFNIQY